MGSDNGYYHRDYGLQQDSAARLFVNGQITLDHFLHPNTFLAVFSCVLRLPGLEGLNPPDTLALATNVYTHTVIRDRRYRHQLDAACDFIIYTGLKYRHNTTTTSTLA